jgi:hypothetical protein
MGMLVWLTALLSDEITFLRVVLKLLLNFISLLPTNYLTLDKAVVGRRFFFKLCMAVLGAASLLEASEFLLWKPSKVAIFALSYS